jgi:hypothetical protein
MNDDSETIWKEVAVAVAVAYPGICLEGLYPVICWWSSPADDLISGPMTVFVSLPILLMCFEMGPPLRREEGVGLSVTRSEQNRTVTCWCPAPDCLEGMRKTKTNLSQGSEYPGPGSNLAPSEYKCREIPVEEPVRGFFSQFSLYLITPIAYLTTLQVAQTV